MPFIVTGTTDDEVRAADAATRAQEFYGSTPAGARPVLDMHGWGGLSEELNQMSKRGEMARWAAGSPTRWFTR